MSGQSQAQTMFCGKGEVHVWQAKRCALRPSLGEILSPNTPLRENRRRRIIIIKKGTRARPYCYTFRMTAAEKELIDRKVKASGMSKTDFLIKALSEKPVVQVDNGAEILAELKRQGNNLNQAVKNNYFGRATERELLSCVDLCKKTYLKLIAAIGGS